MTNTEKEALQSIADRIRELASLENAKFGFTKERDAMVKESVRPYMTWFDHCADYIEDVLRVQEKGTDRWVKDRTLSDIIRYNR